MDSSRLGFEIRIILRTQAFLRTWAIIGLKCPPRGPIDVNGHGMVLRAPSANKLSPSFVKSSSTAHLLEVLAVKLLVSYIELSLYNCGQLCFALS